MASMDFGAAFDELSETDFWIDAALVFVGFMIPVVMANLVESGSRDLPNVVYGGITAGAGVMTGYNMVAVGGGVYALDTVAQRTGLKQRVTTLGA